MICQLLLIHADGILNLKIDMIRIFAVYQINYRSKKKRKKEGKSQFKRQQIRTIDAKLRIINFKGNLVRHTLSTQQRA